MKKTVLLFAIILLHQIAFAQSQWKQLNGPVGGPVNCVLNNNGVFYAGTGDGIFVSKDRGATWAQKDTGLVDWNCDINSVAAIGNNVFIATDGGVFRSINEGSSWQLVNGNRAYFNTVTSLYVNGNNLYESTNDSGISVSADSGKTWTWLGENLPSWGVGSVFAYGNKIVISEYNGSGTYFSSDTGKTWVTTDTPLSNYTIDVIAAYNGKLYAGTSKGIYLSKDNGTTWKLLVNSVVNASCLAFDGSYVYAASYGGVSISMDSGATWKGTSNINYNVVINGIFASNDTIFVGTLGGMHWSSDLGTTWHTDNAGLCDANVSAIAIAGDLIFAACDSGVFLSSDAGNTWTPVNNGITGTGNIDGIQALAVKDNEIFAGGGEGMFISTNFGVSWKAINNGLVANNTTISTIAIQGNNIYISGGGFSPAATYLSTNDGASWKSISTGLPANDYVWDFAFAGDTAYATVYSSALYYSINSGTTWLPVNTGLTPAPYLTGIAISGHNIVAGADEEVAYSKDGGASWNEIGSQIINRGGLDIVAVLNDTFYIGDDFGGMYQSNDTCSTLDYSSPINFTVRAFATGNGSIYMGGLNSGVWKRVSSPAIETNTTAISESDKMVLYPNPAENNLTIKAGTNIHHQTISVYNAIGQLMTEQNNSQPVFNIDISSYPPGIYFIKMNGDNGVSSVEKFVKQ